MLATRLQLPVLPIFHWNEATYCHLCHVCFIIHFVFYELGSVQSIQLSQSIGNLIIELDPTNIAVHKQVGDASTNLQRLRSDSIDQITENKQEKLAELAAEHVSKTVRIR